MGFGRIGKVLSRMLMGYWSQSNSCCQKKEALIWIEEKGYKGIHLNEVDSVLNKQNIIFNTIPAPILDRNKLEKVKKDCITRPGIQAGRSRLSGSSRTRIICFT